MDFILSAPLLLESTQPLTEMNTMNITDGKGRAAREASTLTATCEPTVKKIFKHLRLPNLYACTTCWMDFRGHKLWCCDILGYLLTGYRSCGRRRSDLSEWNNVFSWNVFKLSTTLHGFTCITESQWYLLTRLYSIIIPRTSIRIIRHQFWGKAEITALRLIATPEIPVSSFKDVL